MEITSFGGLLRQCRLAASLSQEAVAERAHLSVAAIAALERGRRTAPRPETVGLLADALGLASAERAAFVAAATQGRGGPTPPNHGQPQEQERPPLPPPIGLPAAPATPLLGREHAEAAVTHLLLRGNARLLTVMGPGGVGKTRLALAVAGALATHYADGSAFVDLASLTSAALVLPAIAVALSVGEQGSTTMWAALQQHLTTRHLLLVCDNMEHVLDAGPDIARLVAACPHLTVLATSRVALRVRGEQRYTLLPLDVPTATATDDAEIARSAAVRLFVARSQAVLPTFDLQTANARAIGDLCRYLDGLPLAIELAAARSTLLAPAALLAHLQRRSALLTAGPRDLPARQQTLQAAIDWSYDLLPAAARTLLMRLSVFMGGCTLEAVEAVCNADGQGDVLTDLATLIDSSLLTRTESDDQPRFILLETLRDYALRHLAQSGEEATIRHTHALYFCTQAEATLGDLLAQPTAWLTRWEHDHENVRAALAWTQATPAHSALGLRLAVVMWRFWYVHGHLTEGRAWLETLLEVASAAPVVTRAEAMRGLASMASNHGDHAGGVFWATHSLALFRQIGNALGEADCLNLMGTLAREQQHLDEAIVLYAQSRALYEQIGDPIGVAATLNNLGTALCLQGNLTAADHIYADSLALRRVAGDQPGIAYTLHNMADLALAQTDLPRAADLLAQCLDIRRRLGDRLGCARALVALGHVQRARAAVAAAAAMYRDGLEMSRALNYWPGIIKALEGMAWVVWQQGQAALAARWLSAAWAERVHRVVSLSAVEQAQARTLSDALPAELLAAPPPPTDQAVREALSYRLPASSLASHP